MRHTRKLMAAVAVSMMAFAFFGCSDEENDSEDQISVVELPASVGENLFAGKTFTEADSPSISYVFNDSTVSRICNGETSVFTSIYHYSYDVENSLLYLAPKADAYDYYPYSSIEGPAADIYKKNSASGADLDINNLEKKLWLSTMKSYEYKIEEGNKISLTNYFNGKLPTNEYFSSYTDDYSIDFYNNSFEINSEFKCYVTFKDATFTGKIYKSCIYPSDSMYEYAGSMSGIYACSGIGTEGSNITIIFTSLPDEIGIMKNLPVILTQEYKSPASVGKNPFERKIFKENILDEESAWTYTFTGSTLTMTRKSGTESNLETKVYRYTYDAESTMLYLGFISSDEYNCSSALKNHLIKTGKNDDEIKTYLMPAYKYKILADNKLDLAIRIIF